MVYWVISVPEAVFWMVAFSALQPNWRKVKEVGTATARWIGIVAVFHTSLLIAASPGMVNALRKLKI